jgi:hypothetical protein
MPLNQKQVRMSPTAKGFPGKGKKKRRRIT